MGTLLKSCQIGGRLARGRVRALRAYAWGERKRLVQHCMGKNKTVPERVLTRPFAFSDILFEPDNPGIPPVRLQNPDDLCSVTPPRLSRRSPGSSPSTGNHRNPRCDRVQRQVTRSCTSGIPKLAQRPSENLCDESLWVRSKRETAGRREKVQRE